MILKFTTASGIIYRVIYVFIDNLQKDIIKLTCLISMLVPLSIIVIDLMQYRLKIYPILMQAIFFLTYLIAYLLQDGTEISFYGKLSAL